MATSKEEEALVVHLMEQLILYILDRPPAYFVIFRFGTLTNMMLAWPFLLAFTSNDAIKANQKPTSKPNKNKIYALLAQKN